MEKRDQQESQMTRILITGPESTGKTVLSEALAREFQGRWIPEYARSYIKSLNRRYTEADVLAIARRQVEEYHLSKDATKPLFFDTWLIITRVWLEVVFGHSPDWINTEIDRSRFDLVLLCYPDLAWEPDGIRENGGEMRHRLYSRYRELLSENAFRVAVVNGNGEARLNNAVAAVKEII